MSNFFRIRHTQRVSKPIDLNVFEMLSELLQLAAFRGAYLLSNTMPFFTQVIFPGSSFAISEDIS